MDMDPWIWISMDIHRKSVDMDMDMDVKFHIHGNPDHGDINASVYHVPKKFTRRDVEVHCVGTPRYVAAAAQNQSLLLECFYFGVFGQPIVKRFAPCYWTLVCLSCLRR